MSEPIYEEDGENEFASHFGDGNNKSDRHLTKKNHVHFAIPRWVFMIGLIVIILGVLGTLSWKLGWLDSALGWYSSASVSVTVVEKDTHRAIDGAQVTIGEKSGQTNAQGVADIQSLHSGEVTVSISKVGYNPKSYTTTIYRGQNPLPDVIVEKAPEKVYSFKVTIKDAIAGSGIKAAKVLIGKTELTSPESGVISVSTKEVVNSAHVTKDGFESKEVPLVFAKDTYEDVTAELTPIRYIVFEQEKGGTTDLYTTDFKSSAPIKLTNSNGVYSNSNPSLSPDAKHLAFLSDRDKHTLKFVDQSQNSIASVLYIMDEKGTVIKATDDLNPLKVQWVSNSTVIYYTFSDNSSPVFQPTVVAYNVVSKKRTVLSQTFVDPAQNISLSHLAVSNDGSTIAYAISALDASSLPLELSGIYTVKTDGTARKQISKTIKTLTDMYFASDGTIKYTYLDSGVLNMYSASATAEKDLTKSLSVRERAYTKTAILDRNRLTVLTKDGKYIYIDTKNGKSDVFLLASDGKTESQLTNLGTVSTIALSADEKYVLVGDSTNSLFVVGLASTNAVKLVPAFNLNASFMFKPPILATS